MSQQLKIALAAAALLALPVSQAHADADFVLVNLDGPGEGFNDPAPRAPVLGNDGTTLGEQRLLAFEAAMQFWEAKIDSDVVITVGAQFSPLFCSPFSATLGSAGPETLELTGPASLPRPSTVYASALLNSLAGVDFSPGDNDIRASFNSTLDEGTNCLSADPDPAADGPQWDYRINPPDPSNLTVASTVLHEIAHGLGFLTLVNRTTGARIGASAANPEGFDDQFSLFLRDQNLDLTWPEMTNAARANSSISNGALVWDGPRAVAQSSYLDPAGLNGGQPRMFAPTTLIGGSSVSHWDTTLMPNELMEPQAVERQEDWLTVKAMYDMGYNGNPCLKSDLPNDQWVMFSLDCQPPANEATVQQILGDDIAGAYGTTWIVYEFDPTLATAGAYVQLTAGDQMSMGKGYWLGQVDNMATVIDVPRESSRTPSVVDCASNDTLNVTPEFRRSCFEVPLSTLPEADSLTFLGNPYRRDIPLNDMRIVTDTGFCAIGCTFDEAELNQVAFPRMFAFNGVTETYETLTAGSILPARMGAWAATLAGADGSNPRLQIPR